VVRFGFDGVANGWRQQFFGGSAIGAGVCRALKFSANMQWLGRLMRSAPVRGETSKKKTTKNSQRWLSASGLCVCVAVLACFFGSSVAEAASDGCTQVNSGAANFSTSTSTGGSVDHIVNGTFAASDWVDMTFHLTGTAPSTYSIFVQPNTGNVSFYSHFADGESHSFTAGAGLTQIKFTYGSSGCGTGTFSMTATCTPGPAVTTTSLSSFPNPNNYWGAVAFTATVTSPDGTPTGTVTFKDGATVLGTATLNVIGQATFTPPVALTSGHHSITAEYAGTSGFSGSTSPAVDQQVNTASLPLTVASSGNPSTFEQTVTFTATLGAGVGPTAPGIVDPTGSVTFTDSTTGTTLGTATLVSRVASLSTSALTGGVHTITASYGGDNNYTASSGSVVQTVSQISASLSVAQSLAQSLQGQSVTFTATVAPTDATGSITFKDGASIIGTATLASGVAALAITNLTAGPHTITAVYGGDSNHTGSMSASITHNVLANGAVILRVATVEGDGTFTFSSATPGLSTSVTTSGGSGQTAPISLNPGTYSVTESLPSGFGLTGISCSGAGSTGNVAAKSATIVLAAAETVTCTFSSVNSRKKTVEVISRFLSRRADLLLSNGPDGSRQIDRLMAAGGSRGGTQEGIADNETGFNSGVAGGSSVASAGGPPGGIASRMGLGATTPRPFAQRLSEIEGATLASHADADASVPSPVAANANTDGGTQISFATSLSKIRKYEADSEQRKVAAAYDGGSSDIGRSKLPSSQGAAFSPFDIWTEGHYTEFGDDRDAQDSNGHFGIFYLGADYVVSPSLLIGVLVQYDSTQLSSRTDNYAVSGSGWMAGPYATVRLSDNVFFQGRAAWGTSDNTISPFATYSDSFHTDRWLVSGTLTGLWNWGPWGFRPTASLAYIEDGSAAYTDSLGVVIPDVNVSLGQFKAGPEISYKYELSTGATLVPYLGLNAIWNFDASNNAADFGGTLAGDNDVRGQVELGLKSQFADGAGIDFSVSYDGIGSDTYHATSGRGVISIPLN
jgi:outer membrane autotransporter protein